MDRNLLKGMTTMMSMMMVMPIMGTPFMASARKTKYYFSAKGLEVGRFLNAAFRESDYYRPSAEGSRARTGGELGKYLSDGLIKISDRPGNAYTLTDVGELFFSLFSVNGDPSFEQYTASPETAKTKKDIESPLWSVIDISDRHYYRVYGSKNYDKLVELRYLIKV